MGRLIDADKVRYEYIHAITLDMDASDMLNMLCDIIDNAPTVEAIPKAEYENRLKADMVAILTELQLEIEEQSLTHSEDNILSEWGLGYNHSVERCGEIIQQKINSLKENTDGTTSD